MIQAFIQGLFGCTAGLQLTQITYQGCDIMQDLDLRQEKQIGLKIRRQYWATSEEEETENQQHSPPAHNQVSDVISRCIGSRNVFFWKDHKNISQSELKGFLEFVVSWIIFKAITTLCGWAQCRCMRPTSAFLLRELSGREFSTEPSWERRARICCRVTGRSSNTALALPSM